MESNKNIIHKLWEVFWELQETLNFDVWDLIDAEKVVIRISDRFVRGNGLCRIIRTKYSHQVLSCEIVLAKQVLIQYGYDELEHTFRHEVCHLANAILYKDIGHNDNFKSLCRKAGGSMNNQIAGEDYADCATTKLLKAPVRYVYTCPCGSTVKRTKRISSRIRSGLYHSCGKCGISTKHWIESKV